MVVRDWENIYSTKGIVQDGVLYTVKRAADLMMSRNCVNVLDLACGTGRHTAYLSERGFVVYGLDISSTAVAITKKRLADLNLQNVFIDEGDMFSINFPDQFFDAILCVWSTGHGLKADVKKNITEMYRVLKKDGIVCADFMSVNDCNFMKGTQLEEATFLHEHIDHPDVPHHYSTLGELQDFFSCYATASISPITYKDPNGTYVFESFWVEAIK